MLAGQTSAELENDINQLEASSIVKDFRKSAGPDHLSGKASEKGSLMTNWITYKKRLKGALRRSNVVYKFCFTASTNCEVSVDHVNAIPAGHAMRELLYDVISLTTSDIALGIVGRHEATLDGGEALKELEAKFITGHTLSIDGGLTIQLQEDLGMRQAEFKEEQLASRGPKL